MDLGINTIDFLQLGGTLLMCGITIGVSKQIIKQNTDDIKDIKNRVIEVEKTHKVLTELANDIKWMKESLNKIENKVDSRNCEKNNF